MGIVVSIPSTLGLTKLADVVNKYAGLQDAYRLRLGHVMQFESTDVRNKFDVLTFFVG
jgi:hypothetical protein